MTLPNLLYLAIGTAVALFWFLFAVTSIRERKPRAAWLSGILAATTAAIWLGAFWLTPVAVQVVAVGVVVLFVLLFFLPLGKTRAMGISALTGRVDERDIMFAREEYLPGTEKHDTYYARRPELKMADDHLRTFPDLFTPGGKLYEPERANYAAAVFRVIERMGREVDGPVAPVQDWAGDPDPARLTRAIKQMARHLGAAEVGIARLDPSFVYSHVGRGPEPWGEAITNDHPFAVAFTLEMDYDHVEAAPRMAITEESARQYLQGALVSIALAQHIRGLGYHARAHIAGSNYQIMLPPVAHAAGLGEIGRFGYLISKGFGARVRLGAVTTDLPLVADQPAKFGVQDFCDRCQRCADNCPSRSIPDTPPVTVRGVIKWPLAVETCTTYWRYLGSDCGICMKVCPYSHPRGLIHDLVRLGIRRSGFARRLAVIGEDLFYGRHAPAPRFNTAGSPSLEKRN